MAELAAAQLWLWDSTNEVWVKAQCDASGYLKLDMSAVNLDDLADVVISSPAATHLLAYDAVTSKWLNRVLADADIPAAIARDAEVTTEIATHASTKTGVHGVGARYIAETTVEDLDLAAHKGRHENGGDDEVSVAGLSGELADDQPPKTHGADKHTNVARTLFIPPSNYYSGEAGAKGNFPVIKLDPDTDEFVYFAFMVPSDFVSFSNVGVVWVSDDALGTDGLVWRTVYDANWAAHNEAYNINSENTSRLPGVGDQEIVYVTATNLSLSGLAIGDYVGIKLTRDANHAFDTYERDIDIIGLLFSYVAEQ